MKARFRITQILLFLFVVSAINHCSPRRGFSATHGPEKLVERQIIESARATLSELGKSAECAQGECLFLAFWDFDGTILKGDCSEGLRENDATVYAAMLETGMARGLAKKFPPQGGFSDFWREYQRMDHEDGHIPAYTYLAVAFDGADQIQMAELARAHFTTVLRKYYFAASVGIFQSLRELGVENHIISASPDYFVTAAAHTLPVSVENIHGVAVETRDGKIGGKVLPPLTYAEGKTEKLRAIIDQRLRESGKRRAYAIAGFGNSFHTDGPFLKHIATQALPAGKPQAVMINGGKTPGEYQSLFLEISLGSVTGE